MARLLVTLLVLGSLDAAAESFDMIVLRGSTVARAYAGADGVVREETLWEAPRREPPPAPPAPRARPDDEPTRIVVAPVPIVYPAGVGGVPLFLELGPSSKPKLRGHPGRPHRARRLGWNRTPRP